MINLSEPTPKRATEAQASSGETRNAIASARPKKFIEISVMFDWE